MKAATLDGRVGIFHIGPWKSTIFWVLLTTLLPVTAALQWTDSPTSHTQVASCSNSDIYLPGNFTLSPGEEIVEIKWIYRAENGSKDILAIYIAGYFNPMAAFTGRVKWTGQAGIAISQAAGPRSRQFSVVVRTFIAGKAFETFSRTITVQIIEPPTAKTGELKVRQESKAVYDNTTGEWRVQLTCGVLTDLGHPAADAIWTTPEGHTMESSSQDNGTFRLLLPNPPSGGNYTCTLPPLAPATRCLPPLSPLLEGATVTVDEVKARFTLLEARQREKEARHREIWTQLEAMIKEQESKINQQESKIYQQESKINQQESKIYQQESNNKQQEAKINQQEAKITQQKAKINQQEAEINQLEQQLLQVKSELGAEKKGRAILRGDVSSLQARLVKDCVEAKHYGRSGVVTIYPEYHTPLQVYCDQFTGGGGWLVFQRRQDGSVDFYRNWADYQEGFGDINGEFWLGLESLHMLTSRRRWEFRVDLMGFNGRRDYTSYRDFKISDSNDKYRLSYAAVTGGTAGNSLDQHNKMRFTTKDADNDIYRDNCARRFHGAYWYYKCHESNLNGRYYKTKTNNSQGVVWTSYRGTLESMKFSEMKIRPM